MIKKITDRNFKSAYLGKIVSQDKSSSQQGGDSSAGTQALPVGKIIETKVCRKDNPNLHMLKEIKCKDIKGK